MWELFQQVQAKPPIAVPTPATNHVNSNILRNNINAPSELVFALEMSEEAKGDRIRFFSAKIVRCSE